MRNAPAKSATTRAPAALRQAAKESTLTQRELEILRLMAAGQSNKDIGVALSIAAGTVKIHVHSILLKLNVSSRTEAVTKGSKFGMLR
jgi:ATP/maltotriose-dependent transcriptional regulator MalT